MAIRRARRSELRCTTPLIHDVCSIQPMFISHVAVWLVSLSILLSGVQTVWSSRARPLTPADDCAPGAGARPVARRVKETPPQGMGNACSVSHSKVKKEPSVKPNSLIPMAGATRLELATSGVTGRRSNQTELRPRIRGQRVC
jgi:hypothetical protein